MVTQRRGGAQRERGETEPWVDAYGGEDFFRGRFLLFSAPLRLRVERILQRHDDLVVWVINSVTYSWMNPLLEKPG
jgi:hypothetical protein